MGAGYDPRPNGYEPSPDLYRGGGAVMFSGAGTKTDRDIRNAIELEDAKRAAELSATHGIAEDPYARERLKGQYEVRRAVAPAEINAQADELVAKTRASSDDLVARTRARSAMDVERARGQNAIEKDRVQYEEYDQMIDDAAAAEFKTLQASGLSDAQLKSEWQQRIKPAAAAAKWKIRELGIGGAAFRDASGFGGFRPEPDEPR
jgi:hypothetical protein